MKTYTSVKSKPENISKEIFDLGGLRFSSDFPNHCLMIADTIANHNIWLKPKKYNSHLLSYENNNLLFLLGLVDTIEPIKCLSRKNKKISNNNPYDVIDALKIGFVYEDYTPYKNREIELFIQNRMKTGYDKIVDDLNAWLNVEVIINDTDCVTIAITPNITNFTINSKTNLPIDLSAKNATLQLQVDILPANARQKVTWQSSHPSIATVDDTGLVTGINTGSATISATATDGSKIKDSVIINVSNPVH